ncbi:MAG: CPBP family intramembrane metalloprotease [Melioribacteraceae bacterium]|nr:CPBP family intramembrane metalloprotease [Melioribacteraceae bacterium]MCF8356869.1 CPBP family intramembrane metalloprotease [Melioribacteraceae bacterium]MCF8394530.1 CPBP family intramembrane metalloprotease [Melioribacteraceae bacterium]MCF8420146.1 CPBP family intramembrane metalloprotease [Melioribacteraceae bacterium]
MKSRNYLIVEFITVFIVLPLIMLLIAQSTKKIIVPFYIILGSIFLLVILFDRTFDKSKLLSKSNFKKHIKLIILRFTIGVIVLITMVSLHSPEKLFSFVIEHTNLWLLALIFYPVLSVIPQELFFRVFFFHRYETLFSNRYHIIIINGICFGLAHLFYGNFAAPVLSTLGGIMFAYTYSKSNSLLITSIEHGLWGVLIFTIGLGDYFYSGFIGL